MNFIQRIIISKYFATLLMLFAIYGCQTTENLNTSRLPVSDLKSEERVSVVNNLEPVINKTTTVENEKINSDEDAELKEEQIEKFQKRFFGIIEGHGGTAQHKADKPVPVETKQQTADESALKSVKPEKRPFKELEEILYGNWINYMETESYEFHDDGTVIIIVTGQRNKSYTLKGNYKLVEKERIKFDFKSDFLAREMPPRHYKITISENEFALTDEPKESGGPDGPATKYKRIK